MASYATSSPFAERRRYPRALAVILAGHAALIGAVMVVKMDLPASFKAEPTKVDLIPLPKDPPPSPPEPRKDPRPSQSVIDQPQVLVPIPAEPQPALDPQPLVVPQPGLLVGPSPDPGTVLPPSCAAIDCMLGHFRALSFPEPVGRSVRVIYPINYVLEQQPGRRRVEHVLHVPAPVHVELAGPPGGQGGREGGVPGLHPVRAHLAHPPFGRRRGDARHSPLRAPDPIDRAPRRAGRPAWPTSVGWGRPWDRDGLAFAWRCPRCRQPAPFRRRPPRPGHAPDRPARPPRSVSGCRSNPPKPDGLWPDRPAATTSPSGPSAPSPAMAATRRDRWSRNPARPVPADDIRVAGHRRPERRQATPCRRERRSP